MSAARKRGRENPCEVCGHFHDRTEQCRECGHRFGGTPVPQGHPSEILDGFLFLGGYDDATRHGVLQLLGISRILNTVPTCQNIIKNPFAYHCLQEGDTNSQFLEAIQFIEQCERDKVRVLVHCMSGKSRSPAIVIAYLMKSKGWGLAQSLQWVKDRRPQVELAQAVHQQLLEYEQRLLSLNLNEPVLQ